MMRRLALLPLLAFAAACSDQGTSPTNLTELAPTLPVSVIGDDPATDDLCAGLSPCDAFDYDRDGDGTPEGLTGFPGVCFLPPMVDNHLSDPACSADFVPGLDGVFKLAWCEVQYSVADGSVPPTIVRCQDPAEWQSLVESDDFYTASVRFRRNEADVGDTFRLYVVRGDIPFAHRDVVVDPNLTAPADGFVHAIGFGNEPVKVRITESFGCVFFDTQGDTGENAATCLINGASELGFETNELTATFTFPEGNPPFFGDFEVSECLSLGFSVDDFGAVSGNALVDVPLADCMISVSSEELEALTVPAEIVVEVSDDRWISGPFADARLNVLQHDEQGTATLPPSVDPGWFGPATSSVALLRWMDWGLDRLASVFGVQPLHAGELRGAAWDWTRMSDFQLAVIGTYGHGVAGSACAIPAPYCLDLGTFPAGTDVPVSVVVSAPTDDGSPSFLVPDTRLHFFPSTGSVSCPAGTEGPIGPFGRGCYPAGVSDQSTTPVSVWDHLVFVTGSDGAGTVDWTLAEGLNSIDVSACGVARPGDNEPDPPGEPGADGVWGTLGECSDREAALTAAGAFDNGPADGHTPFESVDLVNEVAIYGLPLTFEARTCPDIVVDGLKGDATGTPEWEACAEKTAFSAPLKGPKGQENAWLYTYTDGATLFLALEVETDDLGNKIFFNLVESFAAGDGVEAAGDELLLLDFGDPTVSKDWHLTQACVDNNSSSLCGGPDAVADGALFAVSAAASVDGAGPGRVFYEFGRPLGSPNATGVPKEDLNAVLGQQLGLRLQVTQGQGGGKGGFIFPDPQRSPVKYHAFILQ